MEGDGEAVSHIAELTSTQPEQVEKALLFRTVATGGGEVIEKGHSEQEACFGRKAFSKVSGDFSKTTREAQLPLI